MKRMLPILLAALICLSAACGKQEADPGPADPYAGYESGGRLAGGSAVNDANARSVEVTEADGDVTLLFSFITGSRMSGSETEAPAEDVPAYSIYTLDSPARLVIEFDALSYWDFTRDMELPEDLFFGWFRHSLFSSPTVAFYFQLTKPVQFMVEATKDTLSVKLHPTERVREVEPTEPPEGTEPEEPYSFYVVSNEYMDYCNGVISREIDMHPVLASDFSTLLLISDPFATQLEAEQFRANTLALTEGATEERWSVVALYDDDLPDYDETLDYLAAYSELVIRKNGEELTPEVLIPFGRFLAASPTGGRLFTRRQASAVVGEMDYYYEELWVIDAEGTARRMVNYEFATIEKAVYSTDGHKLAVLERAEESTRLYIFNVDTAEMIADLSSLGFGTQVSNFAWDNFNSVVYGLSGSGEMELHMYDFTVLDDGKRYSHVSDKGADEGSFAYLNGELMYALTDEDGNSSLYRIKPQGGVPRKFIAGSAFELSRSGLYLAVFDPADMTDEGRVGEDKLLLYNTESGETRVITDDFSAYDYVWNRSGSKLYYVESLQENLGGEGLGEGDDGGGDDGGDDTATETPAPAADDDGDPYNYALWVYDVETDSSERLFEYKAGYFLPGEDDSVMYFVYSDADTLGARVSATYKVTFD